MLIICIKIRKPFFDIFYTDLQENTWQDGELLWVFHILNRFQKEYKDYLMGSILYALSYSLPGFGFPAEFSFSAGPF